MFQIGERVTYSGIKGVCGEWSQNGWYIMFVSDNGSKFWVIPEDVKAI